MSKTGVYQWLSSFICSKTFDDGIGVCRILFSANYKRSVDALSNALGSSPSPICSWNSEVSVFEFNKDSVGLAIK
eukprot:1761211-Amphidinium_carterae.1